MATTSNRQFRLSLLADPTLTHEILALAKGRASDIQVDAVPVVSAPPAVVATPQAAPIPKGLSARAFIMQLLQARETISQKELMDRGIGYGFSRGAVSGGVHSALKDRTLKRPRPGVYARGKAFELQPTALANGHANGEERELPASLSNVIHGLMIDGQHHRIGEIREHVVKAGFSKTSVNDALGKMLKEKRVRRVATGTYTA